VTASTIAVKKMIKFRILIPLPEPARLYEAFCKHTPKFGDAGFPSASAAEKPPLLPRKLRNSNV
jgi:hypothetical protein